MNDIERAMALLRQEREALAASRAGAIPSETNPDDPDPAPSVAREAGAGRSPDGDIACAMTNENADRDRSLAGRQDAIGGDMSAVVGSPPSPADGARAEDDLADDGRPHAGASNGGMGSRAGADAPEAVPCERAPRRFDDTLFADDLAEGSEPASSASMSTPDSPPPPVHTTDVALETRASENTREAVSVVTARDVPFDEGEPSAHASADRKVVASDAEGGGTPSERVVSLPLKRLAARGFLTPDVAKGRLSEEFRRVKRPILRNIADAAATDGHRNVVMVTSSVAGEGKTYTAINLAMSLAAERKRTVLLVDADVLKGSAGIVLGLDENLPGLVDVLDDERMDVAEVMLATDVPDLRIIPAGRRDEHTTELLSSPRMSDLIDELAGRYADRIIVLDCPPMLQTNEANVIADHAGQVVFVVAGEETDQRLVLEAMERFDKSTSVGILLNKASGSSAAYGYDYGYG